MNLNIFSLIKRRWRRGGFGVHSPFAFTLITRVITERGEYYRYKQLRELPADTDFKTLALVFRLVCRFQPSTVAVIGSNADTLAAAVAAADSRISIVSQSTPNENPYHSADCLIVGKIDSDSALKSPVDSALKAITDFLGAPLTPSQEPCRPSKSVVIANLDNSSNRQLWHALTASKTAVERPHTMSFETPTTGILCLAPHFPSYSVKI